MVIDLGFWIDVRGSNSGIINIYVHITALIGLPGFKSACVAVQID